FSFARGFGAFDQDVIATDDVFVAHGIAADFEGEDFAVPDDVGERNALGGFDGFDWLAGGDAAEERKPIESLLAGAWRQDIDGAAAVVSTLQQTFVLQVGDMLVYCRQRGEA